MVADGEEDLVYRFRFDDGSPTVWGEPGGKAAGNPHDSARDTDYWMSRRTVACFFPANSTSTEIAGIDPATGKERHGLEWFDGSVMGDILPDGKAIVFLEWGGPAGPLYLVVYRKLDGSAPVALGPGADAEILARWDDRCRPILTRPPQVGLNPIGTGESRRLPVGDITSLGMSFGFRTASICC